MTGDYFEFEEFIESSKMNSIVNVSEPELAVRILQSNNVFTQGPNFLVDEMTDSTGTKNTINTGTTTALYDDTNSYYVLNFTDEASGDTTANVGYTNPANAFDSNDSTFANISDGVDQSLGKTFSSKYVGYAKIKCEHIAPGAGTSGSRTMKLQTFDGVSWNDVQTLVTGNVSTGTTTFDDNIFVDDTVDGIRVISTDGGFGNVDTFRIYTIEYGDFDSSSIVVADTNSISLDGNEKGFIISVPDSSFPTNTSMTVTISDGTNSLGAETIDTIAKGIVVEEDGTLTSGTLKVTFTLSTTDDTVTPTLKSYAIKILR